MAETWKRFLAAALCLCMLVSMCPTVNVFAEGSDEVTAANEVITEEIETEEGEEEDDEPERSGSCGTNVSWELDSGTLTISGSGSMSDFTAGATPWYAIREEIEVVVVESGVNKIGRNAFAGCTDVTTVYFEGNAPGTIGTNAFSGVKATVYYPASASGWTNSKRGNYGGTLSWVSTGTCGEDLTWTMDGNGLLTISGSGDMDDYTTNIFSTPQTPWTASSVKTVVLPEGLTSIGDNAFRGSGLSSIEIPAAVTSVGSNAFTSCGSLKTLTFLGDVPEFGRSAFGDNILNYATGKLVFRCEAEGVEELNVSSMGRVTLELTHPTPGKLVPGKAATCTEDGLTDGYECTACGAMLTEQTELKAPGHTEVVDEGKAATCTEDGLTQGKHCSVCEEVLVKQEVIPAKGHTEVVIEAKAATCTEDGMTGGSKCSVCDAAIAEPQVIPAKGHTEVVVKGKAATCTEDGLSDGKTCSVCELVLVEQTTIPAAGHTEVTDEAVPAACTEAGKTEGKHCSACGTVFIKQETVPATGHTVVDVEAKEATCTEDGRTAGTGCSVCGAVVTGQEVIKAKGHSLVTVEGKKPTCTEAGVSDQISCSVCEFVQQAAEEIKPLGHTEVIDEAVPATCTEAGKTEGKHCSVCNEVLVKQEVAPAKGHTEAIDEAVPATCTEDGKTAGKHCSVCNEVLVKQEVDPAKGHTEVVDEAVEPTFLKPGLTEGKHCSVCEEILVKQETVPVKEMTGACGEHLTWVLKDGVLTVTGTGEMTDFASGEAAWEELKPLIQDVILEDTVKTIGSYAFSGCTGLKSIAMPEELTKIGTSAFAGCTALTSLSIPEHVETISASAFAGCTGVKTVLFIGGAPEIGEDAFQGITAKVSYPMDDATWTEAVRKNYGGRLDWSGLFSGSFGIGLSWKLRDDGTLTITGKGSMNKEYPWRAQGSMIRTVEIGDGVTDISDNAFRSCKNLETVSIGSGVTVIGKYAFCESGLKQVVVGNAVTEIGEGAFYHCERLTSAKIIGSASGITVGDAAFTDCAVLAELDLGQNVTSIGRSAFNKCAALTSAAIPAATRSIGISAFAYCTALKDLTIAEGIAPLTIGGWAFQGCSAVTSLCLPANVGEIGTCAFLDCTGIRELDMQGGETLGEWAFGRCTGLTTIHLPKTVTKLSANVFNGASNLKEVAFAGDAPVIDANAFKGTPSNLPVRYVMTLDNQAGWAAAAGQNYGGKLAWIGWAGVTTEEELTAALAEKTITRVIVTGSFTLAADLTIPTGKVVLLQGDMTIGEGVKITNKGNIEAEGGSLIGYTLKITSAPERIMSGNTFKLAAEANVTGIGGGSINWTVNEGAEEAVMILADGTMAALEVTEDTSVTLTASNALAQSEPVQFTVVPAVREVKLFREEEEVTSTVIGVDVSSVSSLTLRASCVPEGIAGDFAWKSSSELCTVASEGDAAVVTFGALPTPYADAKITVQDLRSGKTAAVTLRMFDESTLQMPDVTLVGGQSTTLKKDGAVWSLDEQYAGVASITAAGKLTTKVVGESTEIVVTAAAKNAPEVMTQLRVKLLPRVQSLDVITAEPYHSGMYAVAADTVQMSVAVFPEDAQSEGTWKVSPASVATVTRDGMVKFLKNGKATVTFTAADGSKMTASAVLMHGIPAEEIVISGSDTVTSGSKITLKATVSGIATQKSVLWSSSNPEVATVSKTGAVSAKTVYVPTTVTIRAEAADGSGTFAEQEITVNPKSGTLALYCGEAIVNGTTLGLAKDEILYLTASEDVTWTSSSAATVRVEEDGTVIAVKTGSATITAKSADGKSTGKVTVRCVVPVESLEIQPKTAVSGDVVLASGKGKITLTAKVSNSAATVKTVAWSSSNPAAAAVSSSGAVTAKAGVTEPVEVIIRAVAKDGTGVSAEFPIWVAPAATFVTIRNAQGHVVNGRTLKADINKVQTFELSAQVYPTYDCSDVTWKSSNTKVATVVDGTVTLKGTGTTTITATSKDGSGKQNSVKLTVGRFASAIEVKGSDLSVAGGSKLTLKYSLVSDSALTSKAVTFALRPWDTAYASVSSAGVITAKKVTEAHEICVTVALKDNPAVKTQVKVMVTPAVIGMGIIHGNVQVNGKTITGTVGTPVPLTAVVMPMTASQKVEWSVKGNAKVDENGNVTASAAGTVTVTAKTVDGSKKSASVTIRFQ